MAIAPIMNVRVLKTPIGNAVCRHYVEGCLLSIPKIAPKYYVVSGGFGQGRILCLRKYVKPKNLGNAYYQSGSVVM